MNSLTVRRRRYLHLPDSARFVSKVPSTLSMPTILRTGPYRVYFFSHDISEPPHAHVDRDEKSAKSWLAPVGLARNLGFNPVELKRIERLLQENQLSLLERWRDFFDAQPW